MSVLNENSVRNAPWMYNTGCFVPVWRGPDLSPSGAGSRIPAGDQPAEELWPGGHPDQQLQDASVPGQG